MSGKKVLLIAHEFPPIGGVGAQRPYKFTQYLRLFGYEPVVLTQVARYSATWDDSLLEAIADIPIYRAMDPMNAIQHRLRAKPKAKIETAATTTITVSPSRSNLRSRVFRFAKNTKDALMIPDETMLWIGQAVKVGEEVIQKEQIKAIYVTSPPASSLLVGARLSERTGLPLILDFRDPFVRNLHRKQYGIRHRIFRYLEAYAIVRATRIITVTDSFRDDFQKRYPSVSDRFHVIPNGFDRADVKLDPDIIRDTSKMTLYYGGILYGKRSPKAFLQGLQAAIAEGAIARDDIAVHFAGVFDYPGKTDNLALLDQLQLTDVVSVIGYVAHQEHVKWMSKADVLLLIGDQTEGAGAYVPAKIYEYLGIGRPILALVQPGEASHLIEICEAGVIAPPDQAHAIKKALISMYEAWKRGDYAHFTQSPLVRNYDRKEQARLLAGHFDDILHE